MICSEIFLQPQAPGEYQDRATLWNAVERAERGKKAQLAYSFDIAFDAVPTTDWGTSETLEHWREVWAAMVNAKFGEKRLTCRVDHRSYERQGLDLLPTVHEGVAVCQMEAKGITTDKGDLNRWIDAEPMNLWGFP